MGSRAPGATDVPTCWASFRRRCWVDGQLHGPARRPGDVRVGAHAPPRTHGESDAVRAFLAGDPPDPGPLNARESMPGTPPLTKGQADWKPWRVALNDLPDRKTGQQLHCRPHRLNRHRDTGNQGSRIAAPFVVPSPPTASGSRPPHPFERRFVEGPNRSTIRRSSNPPRPLNASENFLHVKAAHTRRPGAGLLVREKKPPAALFRVVVTEPAAIQARMGFQLASASADDHPPARQQMHRRGVTLVACHRGRPPSARPPGAIRARKRGSMLHLRRGRAPRK